MCMLLSEMSEAIWGKLRMVQDGQPLDGTSGILRVTEDGHPVIGSPKLGYYVSN